MNLLNESLESERLKLSPLTKEYREEIFKEFTPEITVFMYPRPAENIEETDEFISRSMDKIKKGQDLQMVVLDKNSNEFIGCTGLHNIDTRTPELGIWLKKSAQGKGRGLETMQALKKWADKNLEYAFILYPVAEENVASRKIAELLGGKIEREYDQTGLGGNKYHCLEYRIYPDKKTA